MENQGLLGAVTCPICFNVPTTGLLFQCPVSHIICDECFTKMKEVNNNACPTCREDYKLNSNGKPPISLTAMAVLETLTTKCRYEKDGCPENLPRQKMSSHEDECIFQQRSCRFKDFGCQVMLLSSKMKEHEVRCKLADKLVLMKKTEKEEMDTMFRAKDDVIEDQRKQLAAWREKWDSVVSNVRTSFEGFKQMGMDLGTGAVTKEEQTPPNEEKAQAEKMELDVDTETQEKPNEGKILAERRTTFLEHVAKLLKDRAPRRAPNAEPGDQSDTSGELEPNKYLLYGAMKGDRSQVLSALEADADVNHRGPYRRTAAHWAALRNSSEILKLLIEKNADLSVGDRCGMTPLMFACKDPYGDGVVATLLNAGVTVSDASQEGLTAMHYAAGSGNLETVKQLLKRRPFLKNVKGTKADKCTPLGYAIRRNQKRVAKYLAARRAMP